LRGNNPCALVGLLQFARCGDNQTTLFASVHCACPHKG
jgi:hypothetical protein